MKTTLNYVKNMILLMVMVLSFSILGEAQTEISDYTEAGNAFFEKGLYDSAIRSYIKALEESPDDVAIVRSLGQSYVMVSDYDSAIDYFTKEATLTSGQDWNTFYRLAECHRFAGEYDSAFENYVTVVKINREHTAAYFRCGESLYNAGEYTRAVEWYRIALEINPDDVDACIGMGCTLLETGEWEEARTYLGKAHEIDNGNLTVLVNLANALRKLSLYDDALELYEKTIEADPLNYAVHYDTGMTHYNNNEFDAAIDSFTKALELRDDFPEAYNGLGLSYLGKTDTDSAKEYLEKTLSIDPYNVNAYRYYAQVYSALNDTVSAIERYTKAFEIQPNHTRTLYELGKLYQGTGEFSTAREFFNKAYNLDRSFSLVAGEIKRAKSRISKPVLSAQAKFVNFFGDGILYGNARGAVEIEIENSGEGAAHSLSMVVTPLTPFEGITYELPSTVTRLPAGRKIVMRIPFKASQQVPDGEVTIKIAIKEEFGNDLEPPLELTITTRR